MPEPTPPSQVLSGRFVSSCGTWYEDLPEPSQDELLFILIHIGKLVASRPSSADDE